MSRTVPLDDDVLNPKLAASCLDFLLIELVPLAYRITAELTAREEASMTAASRQHLYGTKALPDRTSVLSGTTTAADADQNASVVAGKSSEAASGQGAGVGGGDEDDEAVREAVYYRLDALGYRVGQGLTERFSADQPRPTTQLDSIKFVCKDLWTRLFRKQIDNLKTNHRGTFVLTDSRFQPLHRISADRKLGPRGVDVAVQKAQAFLWFPCGVIRGALSGLGMDVTVHAESTDLPVATFQIRVVGSKP